MALTLASTEAPPNSAATLLIGHAVGSSSAGEKKGVVDFDFDELPKDDSALGFSVESTKGSIELGSYRTVNLAFTPTAEAVASSNLGVVAALGLDQWTEIGFGVRLKGGAAPQANPVNVTARARVPAMAELQGVKDPKAPTT